MLRTASLLALALAATAHGWAQCVSNQQGVPTGAEYVEARRPVVDMRKLSKEESADAKRLVSAIKARVKDNKYSPRLADLEALRVYGSSGDRDIMKTLVEGYMDKIDIPTSDGLGSGDPAKMLAGLWAMQLYIAGDRSREMAQAVSACIDSVITIYRPIEARGKCGFDLQLSEHDYDKSFEAFAKGKGRLPKQVTFEPKSLATSFSDQKTRFEQALAKYRSGADWDNEQAWGKCWAERQGGDYLTAWKGSEQVASQAYKQEQENKVIRAQNEIDEKTKIWTALQAKRVDLKKSGRELSDDDFGKWVSASFWLGGKYLEPYASEHYLVRQTAIDSLCRGAPGVVCDRQKRIYQRLADEARLEAEMKDARWRAAIADNAPGSTSVRTYDQNGNYLGSTSMPSWQADILSGK